MSKTKSKGKMPVVHVDGEVLRQIRQHARSSNKTEVCGVLIGSEDENSLTIEARIPGINAAQAGTHVTFTQDTWEHIYKIKDREYPEQRIVGWYHSHPGFGVFLSDHDTFIHKNFFSSPLQVAWVYDPHSDEEGCFGWVGNRLERLSQMDIRDNRGGEGAGETGKPEPMGRIDGDDDIVESLEAVEPGPPGWLRWVLTIFSHVLLLALGFVAAWIFFPRPIIFLVNPYNGTAVEAPPGTRIHPNGSITIPDLGALEPPPAEKSVLPTPADNPTNPAPKTKSGKDKNVPKQ